ncbi:hypothetical protein SEA_GLOBIWARMING_64 [Arthrobacter phage GlobiWarming]|nr:hypothetical protein SEA_GLOBIWARMING_64 [Arthrobacter phage GlobiWarming]
MTHAHLHAARPTLGNARPNRGAHSSRVVLSDTTPEVMSLPRVTLVTQLSSDSLRARTRRASDETYVTHIISMLTSDTSDTTLQLSVSPRTHALAVRLIKTCVTNVTRVRQASK